MSHSVDSDHNGTSTMPIYPILNAEQVLARLLALIRGSHSVHQFTREYLSEKMGVSFKTYRHGYHAFGEQVTSDWRYNLEMNESVSPDIGARFSFSFDSKPGASPDMTDICQIDFDRFKIELEAMGFTSAPHYIEHGRLASYKFSRPNSLYIEVYPEGEASEPIEKISHLCVQMVLIY